MASPGRETAQPITRVLKTVFLAAARLRGSWIKSIRGFDFTNSSLPKNYPSGFMRNLVSTRGETRCRENRRKTGCTRAAACAYLEVKRSVTAAA